MSFWQGSSFYPGFTHSAFPPLPSLPPLFSSASYPPTLFPSASYPQPTLSPSYLGLTPGSSSFFPLREMKALRDFSRQAPIYKRILNLEEQPISLCLADAPRNLFLIRVCGGGGAGGCGCEGETSELATGGSSGEVVEFRGFVINHPQIEIRVGRGGTPNSTSKAGSDSIVYGSQHRLLVRGRGGSAGRNAISAHDKDANIPPQLARSPSQLVANENGAPVADKRGKGEGLYGGEAGTEVWPDGGDARGCGWGGGAGASGKIAGLGGAGSQGYVDIWVFNPEEGCPF